MKLLEFRYEMTYTYDSPINGHYFTLKCVPGENCRQKIRQMNVSVTPNEYLSNEKDTFGNEVIIGHCLGEHDKFEIVVSGVVDPVAESGADIFACGREDLNMVLRNQSAYTMPGEAIMDFYDRYNPKTQVSTYEKAVHFMRKLYECIEYKQGVTDINTTAEQAMQLKCGVCQDYSHILLSLLRIDKIPCRYVVGMMPGEGYSHAWVEVYCKGFWYGLDATNNLLVTNEYIKISNGRDFGDCIVNKGIYRGCATETQKINVAVKVT